MLWKLAFAHNRELSLTERSVLTLDVNFSVAAAGEEKEEKKRKQIKVVYVIISEQSHHSNEVFADVSRTLEETRKMLF